MSTISNNDAMQLVADIRRARVGGHVIAARMGGTRDSATAAFVGGLETVLSNFLERQGFKDAAAALLRAMTDAPTPTEIATRHEHFERLFGPANRSAS